MVTRAYLRFFMLLALMIAPFGESLQLNECRELDPEIEYYCPTMRYCEWDSYPMGTKIFFRRNIGYRVPEWNYEEISQVEQTNFRNLRLGLRIDMNKLGYQEDTHDCCLGHYEQYSWDDLTKDEEHTEYFWEVVTALKTLGYNKTTWDSGDGSPYDDFWWDELPTEVQDALNDGLCYNEQLWNGVPITLWNETTVLPGAWYMNTTNHTLSNMTEDDLV